MNKYFFLPVSILVLLAMSFSSCKKDKDHPLRVGLVIGLGTLNDRGFNNQAYQGLVSAASANNIEYEVKETYTLADIESNIQYFIDEKFDVIITLGYDAAQPTLNAANANPSIKFMLLDYTFPSLPSNMMGMDISIDEASFPCGFLAAYWASFKNQTSPKVGYVAGPDVPAIQQFKASYIAGVNYFNTRYNRNVTVMGNHASSFADTLQGARISDSLMQLGAEVIFPFAGKTGNGALYAVKNRNKAAIGVDTDGYISIPEVGSVLLTSCMKRLDNAIMNEIKAICNGQFHGGQSVVANLQNNGIALAPYHDFDPILPDSVKQAVHEITQGIIAGTISTGWN